MALLWSSSLSTLRSTYSSITYIKVNLESWSSEYTIFYTPCIPDTYLFSSQYYYLKWISMPHTKFLAFWGEMNITCSSLFMIFLYEMVWKISQSWSSEYAIFYTPYLIFITILLNWISNIQWLFWEENIMPFYDLALIRNGSKCINLRLVYLHFDDLTLLLPISNQIGLRKNMETRLILIG